MTEHEKAERYDLIVGYFLNKLNERVDLKIDDHICYDEWKKSRKMTLEERQDEVADEFLYEMDNIGFWDFAELMNHEVFCNRVSKNNQFYDNVYGG